MFKFLSIGAALLTGAATLGAAAPAWAGKYQSLYDFSGFDDGFGPDAALIDLDGILYGTTYFGGVYDAGTAFSFDPSTNTETVLHSMNLNTDGEKPQSSLVAIGGLLYGANTREGVGHHGTLFSIDPTSNAFKVLYSFAGQKGKYPGDTIYGSGRIYGTTFAGPGKASYGTVFSTSPITGKTKILHAFSGSDGSYPVGVILVHGTLYGTAANGGTGNGVVFSVDAKTGAEATVYTFEGGTDGAYPEAGLLNMNGIFYGTTAEGGAAGSGTVFSIDPTNGAMTTLYSFSGGSDGENPYSALINIGNKLYGTTLHGGKHRGGTLFFFDLATGKEQVVHSFGDMNDGASPSSGLTRVGATLFGTTQKGGAAGIGTIYSYTP